MSTKNVSMKTIAAELGVSINTVSHALRDMDDISPELKTRIRMKAIELGYMPNRVSRSMKKEERPVVAILIESFQNLFFNTLCNHIMCEFIERDEFDFLFLYSPTPRAKTDVVKQCILQRVDCILSHVPLEREAWEMARLNNLQIVMVGNSSWDYPSDVVVMDGEQGCGLAARYLSLFPSNKFLYVGIDYSISSVRYDIFRREIERLCGQKVEQFNIMREDPARLLDFIEKGYRNVFCYCDATAYDMLSILDDRVVDFRRLYPDLHLVGFDGLWAVVNGLRPITTVKVDFPELARKAYGLVKNRLENPSAVPRRIVLPVTLLKRASLD